MDHILLCFLVCIIYQGQRMCRSIFKPSLIFITNSLALKFLRNLKWQINFEDILSYHLFYCFWFPCLVDDTLFLFIYFLCFVLFLLDREREIWLCLRQSHAVLFPMRCWNPWHTWQCMKILLLNKIVLPMMQNCNNRQAMQAM